MLSPIVLLTNYYSEPLGYVIIFTARGWGRKAATDSGFIIQLKFLVDTFNPRRELSIYGDMCQQSFVEDYTTKEDKPFQYVDYLYLQRLWYELNIPHISHFKRTKLNLLSPFNKCHEYTLSTPCQLNIYLFIKLIHANKQVVSVYN